MNNKSKKVQPLNYEEIKAAHAATICEMNNAADSLRLARIDKVTVGKYFTTAKLQIAFAEKPAADWTLSKEATLRLMDMIIDDKLGSLNFHKKEANKLLKKLQNTL